MHWLKIIELNGTVKHLKKYCEIDVNIMMQAISNYRKVYLEENEIELLNYVSLPQTAYTTFLKSTTIFCIIYKSEITIR